VRETFVLWAQTVEGGFTVWEAASLALLFVRRVVSQRLRPSTNWPSTNWPSTNWPSTNWPTINWHRKES
jgi:hypothetical protein